MAAPTYTPPPNDPPSLGDPDFDTLASSFLGWLPVGFEYVEDAVEWLQTEYYAELDDGTEEDPGLSFGDETDTGWFRLAEGQVGFSVGGVRKMLMTSTAFTFDVPIQGAAVQSSATDTGTSKLMKVGAFGLGTDAIPVTPAQLNNVSGTGVYKITSAITGVLDSGACVHHIQGSSSSAMQIGFRSTTSIAYWRRKVSGSWSDWARLFTEGNIVGPVSQSGSAPTGAVFERGANANGEYVRYADGTQICWKREDRLGATFSGVANGVYGTDQYAPGPWPTDFVSGAGEVSVASSFYGLNTTSIWGSGAGYDRNNRPCNSYRFFKTLTGPSDCRAYFVGIGRWY